MLKRVVNVVEVVALLAAATFVVLLFANEPSDPTPTAVGPATSVDGAAIYADNCAGCHGRNGEGGSGPSLAGGHVTDHFPNVEDQIALVTDGRGGMPAWGNRLTEEEIAAVVAYTRSEL